jgi:hypothetical protein
MTVGPQATTGSLVARIASLMPDGWFDRSTQPSGLGVICIAGAEALRAPLDLLADARSGLRIATAMGGALDRAARDFLDLRLVRRAAQSDEAFRRRILARLARPVATRPAVASALTALTGKAPVIVELWRPDDCGAYRTGAFGYGSGLYGSLALAGVALIRVIRPAQDFAAVAGYGVKVGGYGQGSVVYGGPSFLSGAVTDADLIEALEAVRPAGIKFYFSIAG